MKLMVSLQVMLDDSTAGDGNILCEKPIQDHLQLLTRLRLALFQFALGIDHVAILLVLGNQLPN